MRKIINGKEFVLGTCYYPEHWPESLWEEDLDRMMECGIRVVRIAEFAWSKVEREEGVFSFSFFDRFLDLACQKGMQVIFCTPTATPPAWLTEKYPEVLNGTIDGVRFRHGGRRHYNYNSPVYQEKTRIIVEKFASHYGPHPAVIGWQIDNEINCERNEFYSESDTAAFRVFLKEKYGTLDRLNDAWGTVFWNQTYTDWKEVYIPRTTPSNNTNPHQVLDYTRFISHSACRYVRMQSDIIKTYCKPDDFITTNGLFGNLDNQRMCRESLDVLMYDSYPNFAYAMEDYPRLKNVLQDRMWSRNLMEVRAVSSNFGIMEQQSGANGWNTGMAAPTPKPGQMTLWTMQSVAHGADYISYFRWRTCTMGTEIYWHGILDYSGRENRRIREVREIHRKLQAVREAAGSLYKARVAVLKDYDNIWDAQLDVWHGDVEWSSQEAIFLAAQKSHTPLDYVYLQEDTTPGQLEQYQAVFYPHPSIMDEKRAAVLKTYLERGGTLIFGCRSGYKDLNGKCTMEKLPGLLRELTGTDIPEYTRANPDDEPVVIDWDGEKLEAAVFHDQLEPLCESARVLGRYENCYYEGTPGLIRNSLGEGTAYYFGAAFTERTAGIFLKKLGMAEPWKEVLELPEECELAVREKDGKQYYFVLNYKKTPARISLKRELTDLYSGNTVSGEQVLEAFGTAVYRA